MDEWYRLTPFGIIDNILRDHSEGLIHAIELIEYGLPAENRYGGSGIAPLEDYTIGSAFESKLRTKRRIPNKKPICALDLYCLESAVDNCYECFAHSGDLKEIISKEPFQDDLFEMAKFRGVSTFGILYLETIKNDPIKLFSELYVFSVIWDEPYWWKKNYNKKIESIDPHRIHNLLFNRSSNYICRDKYIRELLPFTDGGNRVLLYGIPGNGKTQLAIEMCYISVVKNKTVVWCDASSLTALMRSYVGFLSINNIRVSDSMTSQIVIKLSKWCSDNKNWLFVFNNYNSEGFEEYGSIEPFLPKSDNGSLFFTAIKKEILANVNYVQVEGFTRNESFEFLSSVLKHGALKEDIDKIIERLGCLPLALTQAAVYLNRNQNVSIDEYTDLLNEATISFHEEVSGDNQHKASLYASIVTNIDNLLDGTKLSRKECFLLFMLSFFPESGISGYFLNRVCYYPYRYTEGNYNLDGKVVVPHLYSNAGAIALDAIAQKSLESYQLKLYDKKEFFQIIDVLLESGLCDVIYGNDPLYTIGYFGKVTWIKTHKLVQESIREYLTNSEDMKCYLDGVIDLILRMFYLISSAHKPFVYYGELFELVAICMEVMQNIEDSKIEKDELDFALYRNSLIFTSTIEQIVSNRIIRDYTNKKLTYEQVRRWDRIIELTKKNNPNELFVKEFEYCSLFTPFRGRHNLERLDHAFSLMYEALASSEDDDELEEVISGYRNSLIAILLKGDMIGYRDYINSLLDDIYEAFPHIDRVKASGFGVIQVLDNEVISEITKIYENNNIEVIKIGYYVENGDEPKCLGFIPDNHGDDIINRYSV